MSVKIVDLGWRFGFTTANRFRADIVIASKIHIPILAGQKLETIIKSGEEELAHIESWKAGFFNGFLDRAEELREGKC